MNKLSINDQYFLLDMVGINKEYNKKIDTVFNDFKQGRINSLELSNRLGKLEENVTAIRKIGEVLNERLNDFNSLLV